MISAPFSEKEELYLIKEEKVIILTKMYVVIARFGANCTIFKKSGKPPRRSVTFSKIAG